MAGAKVVVSKSEHGWEYRRIVDPLAEGSLGLLCHGHSGELTRCKAELRVTKKNGLHVAEFELPESSPMVAAGSWRIVRRIKIPRNKVIEIVTTAWGMRWGLVDRSH